MKNFIKINAGEVFGKLTTLKEMSPYINPKGRSYRRVECLCECGTRMHPLLQALRSGQTSSCGCVSLRKKVPVGEKFGSLTIIKQVSDYISPSGRKLSRVLCLCSCGKTFSANFKRFFQSRNPLKSCGCHNIAPPPLGKIFGNLLVISEGPLKGKLKRRSMICRCQCGKECEVDLSALRRGNTKSCGCKRHTGSSIKIKTPVGETFHELTVLGGGGRLGDKRAVLCKCSCGVELKVRLYKVMNGEIRSCGGSIHRVLLAPKNPPTVGESFGKLTVLKLSCKRSVGGYFQSLCKCDCGTELHVVNSRLVSGDSKSCGCLPTGVPKSPTPLKERFGKLVVMWEDILKSKTSKARFLKCVCDCGRIPSVRYTSLKRGTTSCGCSPESKRELEVYNFIKKIVPQSIDIIKNDKTILEGLHLDIFVPHLNFAIEFNGIHWHSEFIKFGKDKIKPGKDRRYHLNKTQRCSEKGIFLLHVWEDEWKYRQKQIKTRIRNLLHLSPKGVFARKTSLVGVSKEDKHIFLEENHIQGDGSSSLQVGLTYKDELVAVMCFKIRKGDYVWELVRYATSVNVVGGFSKLLKAFQRNNEWWEIISFADLSWSKGDLYEKTGWTLDKVLRPDYKYVVDGKRKHKFGYRHAGGGMANKLKVYSPDLSEHQNMMNNHIYRIYDCGKLRYKLIKIFNNPHSNSHAVKRSSKQF